MAVLQRGTCGASRTRYRRQGARGRRGAVSVRAAVELVPAPLTTVQRLACMTYSPKQGYIAWEPSPITFTKNALVLGSDTRPGTAVDVVIPVPTLEAEHAKLELVGNKVKVTQLQSSSKLAMTIDDVRIKGQGEAAVGSTITLDNQRGVAFVVKQMDSPAESPSDSTEERLADRKAWIKQWKHKKSAVKLEVSAAQNECIEERVTDRKKWIAAWRERAQ